MSGAGRIDAAAAMELLAHAPTAELMGSADRVRRQLHGDRTYFTHSLNINPTNICRNRCELCAFWRDSDAPDAYVVTLPQARERLLAAREQGLTDIHIVGGLHPDVDLAYHESLIRMAKEILPSVLVQGLTAVEIHYLAEHAGVTVVEALRRLKEAGLGAIPGGGAEIFNGDVRRRTCSQKITAEQWLDVHCQAHGLGLPTNATMLFGHVEAMGDVVDHLVRLRDLQDRTHGFQAFIALPFHAKGTRLGVPYGPGGLVVARVVAVARLLLDNFPHIRVLANYMDRKLLELLTAGGADDVGGTSLDERIARAAGAPDRNRISTVQDMREFLDGLGLEPVLVNSAYEEPKAEVKAPRPHRRADDGRLAEALAAAAAGRRLSAAEAVVLHEQAPLHELGAIAHRRRMELAPEGRVGFTIDRNISFTNICQVQCRFCAFHVKPAAAGGFCLTIDQIVELVDQAARQGATQVMLQGGLNPELDLAFFERMFRAVKARVPGAWLHSLSPAEVMDLAGKSKLSVAGTLQRLRRAGLDSLPGGGAEILVEDVRCRVSPHKISAANWLAVMETAQGLGMVTTATMVYGLGETPAQRVEHLLRIRELQDRTQGFTAFIPWSFQPNRTQLALPPQNGSMYLRLVALARLVLDNVPHVQAGWVTEGPDLAQLALSYGADDWGGVLMEEKVVRATGVTYSVSVDQVVHLIRQTGMTPAQRTTGYQVLRTF
jgi:dehypoxanthine futalosine cyclase